MRRWRPGWRWPLRIGGLVLILPIITPIIAALLMIGQEVTAPSWIRESVEDRATAVLNGGDLQFGAITVQVGADMHPRIRLTDAVLRDANDMVLARVPMIEAQLSPRGLLFRREVLAQEITLTGAEIALRRAADGRVALAFDNAGSSPALREAAGFAGLLEQFDQVFERPALAALEQVNINGLVINFDDERAGRSWTVDGGALGLDLRGDQTRLTGDVSLLSGRDFVTRITLSYESPRGSPAAHIGMTVSDAAANDIATQSPALSWLSVLNARISAAFRVEIDETGNLGPLSAALKIDAGALQPEQGARPIAFDTARAYLAYDPATGAIRFDSVTLKSDWGALQAEGQAYLAEVKDGLPGALIAQFALTDLRLNPRGLYPDRLEFPAAFVDFRLRLDPFQVSFANISLTDPAGGGPDDDTGRMTATAEVSAAPEGWTVAVDVGVDALTTERVMQIWPISFKPLSRVWFVENLSGGELFNLNTAFRINPGEPPVLAATYEYRDMTVRVMKQQNPITGATGHAVFQDQSFTLVLDQGQQAPPEGGSVDMAGSVLLIPDTTIKQPPAVVRVRSDSSITAALSILDQPPFYFVSNAGLPVGLADGRALVTGEVRLPLGALPGPGVIDFDLTANLTDVRTELLVPDRVLAASALTVTVDPTLLQIAGPGTIGHVAADVIWRQPLGPGAAQQSVLTGQVELSERFIDEFGIGLPDGSVGGAGTGALTLTMPPDAPPAFEMTSDLRGLTLRLPAVGWSKGAGTAGRFEVEGTLGAVPRVDRIAIDAAGLTASGDLTINGAGGLDRARFHRVTLDGWFDAPVVLVGRGADETVGIEINGGALDFRRANFGDSGGEGGPMNIALDRVQVTEGIALTGFRGTFDGAGVLTGDFTGQVNGGPQVRGTVVPQDGQSAVQILSDDAGAVMRAADLFTTAEGGAMTMTVVPTGTEGNYDGTLRINDIRVRDAPALASLLNAISVLGLLQQLGGQGLVFDDVRAEFRIDPEKITVTSSSAVGVGLGISLDGLYWLATSEMDFQGVLSPFYVINGVGSILTRRGEGLIGFNFNLGGTFDNMSVLVNPLSVLTPGMFREIFRRPPPELGQ